MQEPWEIRSDDHRNQDSIVMFIIFCEDENDEPYYFRSFQIPDKLRINIIPNKQKARKSLNNALVKCMNKGLMEVRDHSYKIIDGITENIWCVFDRDLENANLTKIKDTDDANFTSSIQTANVAGLKVAWSNDAFELWVLMHFEPIDSLTREHRNYIYERLTEIFRGILSKTESLASLTNHPMFNYRNNLKRRDAFFTHVLPILKQRTQTAILNSKELESKFTDSIPYHNCNPCTKVHHLVQELLLYGEQPV